MSNNEILELVLSQNLDSDKTEELPRRLDMDEEVLDLLEILDVKHIGFYERKDKLLELLPFVDQEQEPELKTPSDPLKDAHLEKENTQPLIYSNKILKK